MDPAAVKWSSAEFTLQGFVSKFSKSFPVIIQITEGFLGKQEIDSISSSTVIRVHSLYTQRRVTAETKVGKLFSLPVKLTRLKFLVPQHSSPPATLKSPHAKTLENILSKYPLPITVRTSTMLSYKQKGDMKSQDEMLTELTLQDMYEETFLFGHPIERGRLFVEEPIVIPMYMRELKLVVAFGFLNGNADQWNRLCGQFIHQVKNYKGTANITFEEIIMLDKKDVSSREASYSTIEPIYIDISEIDSDYKKPLDNRGSCNVYQYQTAPELTQQQPSQIPLKTESPSAQSFKSLHDVPRDLHNLTVRQVCECLTLLNMSKYAQAFQDSQVDGQLVYDLNLEMMKSCLGMDGLNSIKFLKFRDGWRPNLQG